jgi:hypothetical protein
MVTEESQKNPFAAWDRMNTIWFRYWTDYEEKGKTLTNNEEIKKHRERFKREVQFLIRSSCDPDFHNFLNKRLNYTKEDGRKYGLVARKHVMELTRFILLDKLLQDRGKFVTIRDRNIITPKNNGVTSKSKQNKEANGEADLQYKSYGHLLRIVNHYYPELLTRRKELRQRIGRRKLSGGRRIGDHRERIVETQFSKEEKLPPGIFDLIVARAMRQDATDDFYRRMHMQAEETAKSMICNPIDLAQLLTFKDDLHKIIDEIGANPFHYEAENDGKPHLLNESDFRILIQMLFIQVRTLVRLRWFREKSERLQNKIIFKEPRITQYRKKDAKKAVSLSLQWFKNPESVIKALGIAALSYIRFMKEPQPQVGLWLIQECLQQLTLSDAEKALAYYNIAMIYQQANQHRLMMKWLRKSLQLWEQVGGHPGDEADIYAYMAEYWRLKDNEKYISNRNKAEELLGSDTLTHRRKAFHYLFFANCACMFNDKYWEKRLYELGLISAKDGFLEDFANYFNQCIQDFQTFGQRGPQGGLGRYEAPEDYGERISSSSFKTWFLNPDSDN